MATSLPDNPDFEHLKKEAKALLKRLRAGNTEALTQAQEHLSEPISDAPTLAIAQLVVARQYGYPGWTDLKRAVNVIDTLMKLAAAGERGAVRDMLKTHPQLLNQRGGDGCRTALHAAAMGGHAELVELLLKLGADPNIRCVYDNAYPLHFAAENGDMAVVKTLVEHGAETNGFGDLHGLDVIGWATCFGDVHTEVAAYLLAHGAQHNVFSAVSMGDVRVLQKLGSFNRDIFDKPMAVWEDRRTPIHLAVIKLQPEALTTLLELGANIEAEDVHGFTALERAAIIGATEMADLLLARGATVRPVAALLLGKSDLITEFMDSEPDALKPNQRYSELIVHACERGSADIIAELIRLGASVDVRCTSKSFGTGDFTPLHQAAWYGNLEAIRVLVAHGAELDAKDGTYDATPLGWAEYNRQTEAAALLQELTEAN